MEERRPVPRSCGHEAVRWVSWRASRSGTPSWLVPAVCSEPGSPGAGRELRRDRALAVAPVGVVPASLAATVGMSRGTRTGPTTASRAAQARTDRRRTARARRGLHVVVGSVRSRGEQIRAGTSDWIAALTPMFVALAAAVVLLRVYPWAIQAAARAAARRRLGVGFLGLARAAREDRSTLLPVAVPSSPRR